MIEQNETHPAFSDVPIDSYAESKIEKPQRKPDISDVLEQATNSAKKAAQKAVTQKIQWQKPKPLIENMKAVEAFNPNLMPKNLAGWVYDIAHRMQAPPDFAAVGLMVSLSSVIGRKCGVHPKQKDDWLVIPNLWGMTIGRPSVMKTPSLEAATIALKRLEIEAKADFEQNMNDYETESTLQKLSKEQAEKDAKAALKKSRDDARRILMLEQDEAEKPKRKRYIATDATVEKLGELLSENPNGILLLRDELSGWINTLNKEENTNARAFYLEAWNGSGRYSYDRIGRGTLDIEAVCVSVLGAIQPSKLEKLVTGAIKGYTDDGLLQRFQLSVYPDTKQDWKYIDQYPDREAKEAVTNLFSRIDNWQPEAETEDEFFALRFDNDAQQLFSEWLTDLENDLRKPEIHPVMESHLKKYSSLVPSLALIIFIAESEDISRDSKIDVNSLIKAVCWCEYLQSHAERIFAIGLDSSVRNAKAIAAKIKGGSLSDGFTARDIKRANWTGLDDPLDIKEALEVLLDFHYIQEESVKNESGGRPSFVYHINPEILKAH